MSAREEVPAPGSVFITRKVRFSAAHRYHNPAWSEERNREVFGPCNNPFGHGHNYELEVTVVGVVDPATGMVLNLREVDDILKEEVISRLDHRHLNEEVPEWKTQIPTTENLTVSIWSRIAPRFSRASARLHRVRLYESPDLYAEYLGEASGESGSSELRNTELRHTELRHTNPRHSNPRNTAP